MPIGERTSPRQEARSQEIRRVTQQAENREYEECGELVGDAIAAVRAFADWADERAEFDDDDGMVLDSAERGVDLINSTSREMLRLDCTGMVDTEAYSDNGVSMSTAQNHAQLVSAAEDALEVLRESDAQNPSVRCLFTSENNVQSDLESIIGEHGSPESMSLAAVDADRIVACMTYDADE